MIPLSHLSFVQCVQVKVRAEKKVEIYVFHRVVAVGTVGAGGGAAPYLRRSKWNREPILLLWLSYVFLIRSKHVPIYFYVYREFSSSRIA